MSCINTFKSNDWPCDPVQDNSVPSYPNPSEIDYNALFSVDAENGLIEGRYIAAEYIQESFS